MFNLIKIFLKVVEVGSFSKTGQILNMAPSSIARNIDQLEKELCVTLFHRTTRQLTLTDEGQDFYQGATELIHNADDLFNQTKKQNQHPQGTIRISVFESFGRQWISPLLPKFLAQYPEVKVEIELENRMVDINSENIDLGIRIGRPVDSGLHARMLLPNQTWLCASPTYLANSEPLNYPHDLENHNCLLLNNDRQKVYWYFNNGKQCLRVSVAGNITSKGGTPLVEAAVAHGGVVLMSNWMMVDLVKEGKLIRCLPNWHSSMHEGSSGEIYAVYSGSKFPRPALRAFIDFLVAEINNIDLSL
ncbi:TPA: LysR substrate-binding domain-containing protein [Photobacterium damselae]